MLCGSAYNLLPVYDIMNRIYRSTINTKDTNHDEVHGFLVNLLVRTDEMRGRGDLLEQCRPNITIHKEKSPIVKKHDPPRYGKNAPKDKDEDEADSDDPDYVPNSVKTKGLFAKLTARLKKSFCFKEDLQDRMYQAHHDNKKIRQRQKAMMKHMGIPVSEGSEDNITPPGEWKSKLTWSSSEDSIPERMVRPSPPPHGKGQVEDEEDEDEDEEMDDDEEENDEEDDDDDEEDDE
ncbi:hypothetical protein QYE76_041211 [Lolium multiflorum]|uniref:Uncharacterized protein n=1 Tax=Lolium multiflorum TaxID=4521 RepID=A0AAD8TEV1_LOLMU|nr:hypothetical protein QYE76_041211 [Lolium multiflorum]